MNLLTFSFQNGTVCSSVVAKMTQLYCSQLHVQILTTPMSQPDARQFCTTIGGKLAKVDEEWKFDAIQTLIRDCPGKMFFFSIKRRQDMTFISRYY
jgi:hypothetical protein